MEGERARQIDEILKAAGELEGASLAEYLDRVSGGDSGLRNEISSLLSGDLDTVHILKYSASVRRLKSDAVSPG